MCYNCWEDGPAAAYVNKTSGAVEYFAVSETIMTSAITTYIRGLWWHRDMYFRD